MNRQEEQRVLDIAATASRIPRRVASGRTILATGQGEGEEKVSGTCEWRRAHEGGRILVREDEASEAQPPLRSEPGDLSPRRWRLHPD